MRVPTLLVILAVLVSPLVSAGVAPAGDEPPLRLHRAILDAHKPGPGAPLAALNATASGSYAIVQFNGPILPTQRAALEATGVTLLEYMPDFAYLVRGASAQIDSAAHLPGVYRHVPFLVADKLAPALLRALAHGANEIGAVRVFGWPDGAGALQHELSWLAIDTSAPLTAGEVLQVANLPSVRWIEPAGKPRLLNDVARSILHVESAWQGASLFGAGQIVAIADSGLDTGITATLSPDFAGRLVATHVLSDGGDLGDNFGHGTHVAGSVAGAGVQSGADPAQHNYAGSFAGAAPEASLVIQAFETDLTTGEIIGLPEDYYTLFDQAYADGARLHTNSWGDITGPVTDTEAAYGGYPYGSQRTDQFIWDHPDMAIFFAAGNSGIDGIPIIPGLLCVGGDGVIDSDSLLAPGTAKNVITVGASENLRSSGGLSAFPWLLVSFCFATNPIAADLTSNNPDGMAAFSSRGPTDDGRVKPDLVAPGTNIVSNRSHYPGATPLWGQHETNPDYAYSGGTSMATPLTAGSGVLVRQWLITRGFADPSAAAIKATLLNTAADIAPGQYGEGATQEIPYQRPNSVAGWGRVDLGFITAPDPYDVWVDDHAIGLATGQVVTYTDSLTRPLDVVDSSQPLRVMLTWTDPPASLSASMQLVNDLDLIVTGPDGAVYHGNNVVSGDRTNNVEGVVIANPPIGLYGVEVRAYNVPIETQPYALAVGGGVGVSSAPGQLTLAKTADPSGEVAPGGLLTYTLSVDVIGDLVSGVRLSDTLPLSTTFVSASDTYTLSGPGSTLVTWELGDLAVGQSVTRTLTVSVPLDIPRSATIVNASYQVSGAAVAVVDGPPVGVPVQQLKLWLPVVIRQ